VKDLNALIAGGGIGGLAAACALLQKGFNVTVFEQAGELREVGAGIQISPNGNRALHALGLFEPLQKLSCDADAKEVRLWNTGRMWKLFDLGSEALRKYGFPYMTVFRPDLLRVLANEVRRLSPEALRLHSRVIDVRQDANGVEVQLESGETVRGDMLIGADGVHSRVRAALHGEDPLLFTGQVVWRGLIPMERLPERMRRNVALNWISHKGHVVHYPVQGGRLMNFVGTLENQPWDGPPWNRVGTREDCLRDFAGWHEDVLTLIGHGDQFTQWALCLRSFLDHWTVGRATLLGDAAHPTLPLLGQGAVSSIEDAIVLARCLVNYPTIEEALQRYESVRKPHTYRMVRGSSENRHRFHHPSLAQEDTAIEFVNREWQRTAISDRYDWLFNYDAETVEV